MLSAGSTVCTARGRSAGVWDKTPNGKWHWNGGKGWKSGCPPANYTGPGATQAKSAADAPKQAAKVVTLSSFMSDSDIAARLTERWEGSAGDVHVSQQAKAVVSGPTFTEIPADMLRGTNVLHRSTADVVDLGLPHRAHTAPNLIIFLQTLTPISIH